MKLHRSNAPDRLLELLAERLGTPADPFREDWVIVHARGLGRWIQQRLADENEVCANVRFLQPAEALQQLLVRLLPEPPKPWSEPVLRWSLLRALEARLDQPAFEAVARWARMDGPEHVQRRLAGLAGELAPRFERYALYRPDEVAAWGPDGDWDHVLWHELASADEQDPAARVATATALVAQAPAAALPGRIGVFTPGVLPPCFVRLLDALDQRSEVHLYALQPPSWAHPLASSLGRQAQALDEVLAPFAPTRHDHTVLPQPTGLLQALQRNLLGEPTPYTDDTRPSLRVHGCAGELRQVEVLRDVIHECLAEDEQLQPRDILVLVTDLDRYAPLLRAIFGKGPYPAAWGADQPLPALPFRLADRGLTQRNRAAAALLRAMDLLDTRFEASTVMDLLALPAVADHHGLDAGALEALRELVVGACVHWGADEDHRSSFDVPGTDAYTWRRGLDRLLLGQALGDGEALDLVPSGEVEDKDARSALGAMCRIVDALLALRGAHDEEDTLPAWQARLERLLHVLAGGDGFEVVATRRVVGQLVEAGDPTHVVSWPALRTLLTAALTVPETGRGYLAGGISVSDMVPMRSVPFRVVCVLGLDDGVFPRTAHEPSFDRIASGYPLPGDRSLREDDRGVFLETLLAARDRLELFTTDRSPLDGKRRPPATVLAELQECLGAVGATRSHPLHPFAARRFQDARPWGFDPIMLAAARGAARAFDDTPSEPFLPAPLAPDDPRPIELRELVSFLKNPTSWFCRKVVGVGFYERDDELSDLEPLRPLEPGLEEWGWLDEYVRLRLAGDDDVEEHWRVRDRIPHGNLGLVQHARVHAKVEDLVQRLFALQGAPRLVAVELPGLSGVVRVHGDAFLAWTPSARAKAKLQLDAWIHHVALSAAGAGVTTHVLSRGGYDLAWAPLAAARASALIDDWLELWRAGQRVPLLFWPDLSAHRLRVADGELWRLNKTWYELRDRDAASAWMLGDRFPWDLEGRLPVLPHLGFSDLAERLLKPMQEAS